MHWYTYTVLYIYMHAYTTHIHDCNHIFSGKDDSLDIAGRNHTHAVVMKLVEKLEGKGHHVYTDSPAHFLELRQHGFGACGTVRVNRQGMPPEIKANLARGAICTVAIDESMVAQK